MTTGYWQHEGGYFPTSGGYDINFEIEFYNGTANSLHVINHGAVDNQTLYDAFYDQVNGTLRTAPGSYKYYPQYVLWDKGTMTDDDKARCASINRTVAPGLNNGPHTLPNGEELCFVRDKDPGPFIGKMRFAQNTYELEMQAPFDVFMKKANGEPNIALGMYLDISFALETSGEYSTPAGEWASDATIPIRYYYLAPFDEPEESNAFIHTNGGVALLFFIGLAIGGLIVGTGCWIYSKRKRSGQEHILLDNGTGRYS
eukprot:TRINITY_DN2365_c0_g1_i8.p1 TRINITY_DN2365_c0_g1~~TRINITY_DN2365_c0_g1_i8.p1  ORF type:complete len:257 (+),score=32.13 TRINITY_DN2365_c0_g1_i8:139-909(+)